MVTQWPRKKPIDFGDNPGLDPDPGILNGIFTTLGHSHTPLGWGIYNEFNYTL